MNKIELRNFDILIVDDTPENLRVLSSMLEETGYHVRKALNGKMALTACEAVVPDLILLDIMMPELDGYQVCQQLKASEQTRQVPIIFLSALNDAMDKVKAFSVGGADYINKPFQCEEVLVRINHQLMIQQLLNKLNYQNKKLEYLNHELSRSNAELEQFAHIVSHDLQTPLQSIVTTVELFILKYQNTLNEDGEKRLNRIITAAMRMKGLIHDILSYSKAGNITLEFEAVDCESIVEEILTNFQEDIASSGARIKYSQLPKIKGDRTQLIQLFQNLIGNAIKFRRLDLPLQLNISAEALNDSQWLFTVQDNGIGIEKKNFERVFEIFQRLRPAQYPGSGIGMSICKKIVERHEGSIWLESEVGAGTTFYFTLPRYTPSIEQV